MLPATCEATRGFGFIGDYALRHALPLRPSPPIGKACYLVSKKMSRSVSTSSMPLGSVRSTVSWPPTFW
jgi:hypothetical protein